MYIRALSIGMKRVFIVIVAMILSMGNVDAQSKKELKKIAKRQELIAATTADNGHRCFEMDKNTSHLNITIQDCYITESTVMVYLLISNSDPKDEELILKGSNSSWKDVKEVYRCCNYFEFAIGSSTDFKEDVQDVLVPSGGALKVTMKITDVFKGTTLMNNLNIGIESKIVGERKNYSPQYGTGVISHTYFGNVYYLDVN